jgi:hypothetical protein
MRAQRFWMPVAPDFSEGRVYPALKLAANFHLPDFRQRDIEEKVRDMMLLVRTEARHLGSFIWEWFCLSFQI